MICLETRGRCGSEHGGEEEEQEILQLLRRMKGGDVKIIISDHTQPTEVDEKKKIDDGYYFSFKGWISEVWVFAVEDPKRVTFSLKVGLALILVSILILLRATYDIFGINIIWSIITVAIMFEYTVGATFNKGFNRAIGSLLAGIFAIVVIQIAITSGHVAEPYVYGFSIFFIGAVTSFMKLWPSFVPYEYGFRVTLFTYCLIVASAYRMGNPIRTAMDRLYSIAIGGLVAVLVNVLVFPIWSGEQLHQELVKWFHLVADSLEECVNIYVKYDGTEQPEFDKTVMDDFPDEPAFKKCRDAMTSSSSKLDSLANSAKWEPPHGNFRHFFYPWSEYVKVGAVLRHCAYEVMALHGCLHSEIQAPYNLRVAFQSEILEATTRAAELVRTLGQDIRNMNHRTHTNLLKRVHFSVEQLQKSINFHSYLLTSNPSNPLKKITTTVTISSNLSNGDESLKKQQRRLYSWPSREVDDDVDGDEIPKMRTLESTAALSLATFTSLLIEFVARLDHLVDAVDELAKMAKFKVLK